jgi:hypothetical protein
VQFVVDVKLHANIGKILELAVRSGKFFNLTIKF